MWINCSQHNRFDILSIELCVHKLLQNIARCNMYCMHRYDTEHFQYNFKRMCVWIEWSWFCPHGKTESIFIHISSNVIILLFFIILILWLNVYRIVSLNDYTANCFFFNAFWFDLMFALNMAITILFNNINTILITGVSFETVKI